MERLSFLCHTFTKLKTQFCHQFCIFLLSDKNTLLSFNGFLQILNFVYLRLNNNFIKFGGVLSCVMMFNIILFHHCNCNLTDEAENTLVMWDNNKFCAPSTVEYPSFIINFFVSWLPTCSSFNAYNKLITPWKMCFQWDFFLIISVSF